MSSRSVCRCASHFALWLCECADGGFGLDDLYLPALGAFSRSVCALQGIPSGACAVLPNPFFGFGNNFILGQDPSAYSRRLDAC